MLEARKSRWFEEVFAVYNKSLLRRRFHSLCVSGLEFLQAKNEKIPRIIYANHSSWWDGLVTFQISRAARLDSFIMMEEKQLKKLFPFRWLGAFSVIREKPREALKSINYSADLLQDSNRTLWIFPQGEILPSDARPLVFFNGLSKIIEKTGACRSLALAFRYEFLGEFKPQVFVKICKQDLIKVDDDFNAKLLTETFAAKLTKNLDDLKRDILEGNFDQYKKIV